VTALLAAKEMLWIGTSAGQHDSSIFTTWLFCCPLMFMANKVYITLVEKIPFLFMILIASSVADPDVFDRTDF
jgi:hypothetical protein